ncbi:MAG: permease-like cell division protein FtsX [Myxococcota bacterium]
MIAPLGRAVYFLRTALRGLAATPGTAVTATLTIAVALLLIGVFALLLLNMQRLVTDFGEALQVTAFLEPGLEAKERDALLAKANALDGVERARLVTEDEALERFRSGVGRGFDLLEGLESNPLPASLELTLASELRSAAGMEQIAETVRGWPGVSELGNSGAWVEGYVRAIGLVRGVAIGLGGILALATLLIVANTIRLAVVSRRNELEILALVGASRGFVNTPFLIEGALQGLCGGLLAWATLYGLFRLVLPSFEFGLALLLGGESPRFFEGSEAAGLWAGGMLLGLIGSSLAVTAEGRR